MTRVITHVGVGLVLAGGIFSFYWFQSNRPLSPATADRLLQVAIANADSGHLDLAREQLLRILADIPSHHRARETLATMYVNLRLPREAATALSALPDEYLAENFYDSLSLAEFMMKFGFLFDAEPFLRRLHAISPQQRIIRKELLKCLRICGDNNRAAPLLASSLNDQAEKVELADLLMATAPRRFWGTDADRKFMKRVGQRSDDPYTLLGYARWEEDQGHLAVSQEILRRVLFVQPEWQSAAIRSAIISWQLGLEEEWRKNMQDWDPATLDDADAWFILGVWQQQHNDARSAIRCFGEALQRAPKHSGACWQLIATLREIGLESEAARWKSYAEHLSQLETYCVDFSSFKARPEKVERLAEGCELIGWHHEAAAWYRYGREQWPDVEWPKTPDEAAESATSTSNQDIFDPLDELTATLDFRQFPLPGRLDRDAISTPRSKEAAVEASGWRFENEAAQLGITFRFEQGLPPKRDRAYMFEFAGPGTGVLDYDGDGWPDIHLTQGAKWPIAAEDISRKDELYRNLGNGRFVSVTDSAGLGEPGYSQGSAVGDFDNDGFSDVYVCNIGPNRCYRNNGDGTFSEVTSATGSAGQEWSVSAAWADLNDDGQLDLYVVDYLTGTVFDERCFDKGGRPIQCPPTLFPAAEDRLFLNRGDGTLSDVSAEAGIQVPGGNGMGIVVGRLGDSHEPCVFIANDLSANFLFVRKSPPRDIPVFHDLGVVNGIGLGLQGNAEASMGVAAGDVNGDGSLDLFVTNFQAEASNLYVQQPGGAFEDQANQFGLTPVEIKTTGWGAQFLDVDADGWLDLFVANGHLENFNTPVDLMPPHLFRNLDGKRLDLVSTVAVGSYFEARYLGRSVAVWDWNRDGSEDLLVSHTTDPVAVLTNRTEQAGHRLRFLLVGVESARDAINSQVRVNLDGRTLVRELVGGCGYTATNERKLSVGLGAWAEDVDVEVDWASGLQQRFSGLAVDTEYVLIEGRTTPIAVRSYGEDEVSEAR